MSSKQFVSNCVCSKPTPFCAICYLPISFANPVQKMMEKLRMNPRTMSGVASTRQAEPKDDKKFATFDQ